MGKFDFIKILCYNIYKMKVKFYFIGVTALVCGFDNYLIKNKFFGYRGDTSATSPFIEFQVVRKKPIGVTVHFVTYQSNGIYRRVEKWSSHRPHKSENVGSNPTFATKQGDSLLKDSSVDDNLENHTSIVTKLQMDTDSAC